MKIVKANVLWIYLYVFCLILTGINAYSKNVPEQIQVLFIGNSFTRNNGTIELFKNIAFTAGFQVNAEGFLREGGSVEKYIHNDSCWKVVRSRNWDYLIIQDYQSYYGDTLGVFPPGLLEANIAFQDSIKKINPCAKIIYVAGWDKQAGLKNYSSTDTIIRLIPRIMVNIRYLNNQPGVHNIIAPVGLAWLRCLQRNRNIRLYIITDHRHPARRGTYLYAIVIFSVIFRQNPDKSLYYNGISDSDAHYLCKLGFDVVKDTLNYTNLKSHCLRFFRIGNFLVADPGYSHYEWYINNVPYKGSYGFIFSKFDPACTYSVVATNKKGCKIRSL